MQRLMRRTLPGLIGFCLSVIALSSVQSLINLGIAIVCCPCPRLPHLLASFLAHRPTTIRLARKRSLGEGGPSSAPFHRRFSSTLGERHGACDWPGGGAEGENKRSPRKAQSHS
ncbi:hypothetical protein V8C37DRAFT_392267 [Trichoderma ceciliae]